MEGKGEIWDLDPRILIPSIVHVLLYFILFPHKAINKIYLKIFYINLQKLIQSKKPRVILHCLLALTAAVKVSGIVWISNPLIDNSVFFSLYNVNVQVQVFLIHEGFFKVFILDHLVHSIGAFYLL